MREYNQYKSTTFEHGTLPTIGVLLVNVGSPEAPTARALRPYLKQFLADPRVIEYPKLWWWLILNGIILQTRPKKSAALYKKIWTEQGSPLINFTRQQAALLNTHLQQRYGDRVLVDFAMGYGKPSIESVLDSFRKQSVAKLLVFPLFPQYSSTTTGSVFDGVTTALRKWRWIPELRFATQYHDHPAYIAALVESVREVWRQGKKPQKLVMSFHGMPKRYFLNGDPYHCQCQKTGRLLAEALDLAPEEYLLTFQSLFGKEEWLRPYTEETLKALPATGVESIDVICPGFAADCLETLEEIGELNRDVFLAAGGKSFRYIPALNARASHITALAAICSAQMQGWLVDKGSWNDAELRAECLRSRALYEQLKAAN